MLDWLSISISVVALLFSGFALWFTSIRRGKLKMTQPSVAFLGFDLSPKTTAKIFFRTLLYSTSPQGNVVEAMYATVAHNNSTETFGFWGYGESNNLTPGSGLFVPQEGVAFNHHFVMSVHKETYDFKEGRYLIQIFAKLVTDPTARMLYEFNLTLTAELATALAKHDGVLFELEPSSNEYVGHTRQYSDR